MALKYGIMPAEILGMDQETGLPIYDDRAVDEEYFARYHQELLNNGISAKIPTSFQVTADEGYRVKIKPGAIFIEGYFAYDIDDYYLRIEQPLNALRRIDRIVARLDRVNRNITVTVLKGNEAASNPSVPAHMRNDEIYDMVLCDIAVTGGNTSISNSDITDRRMNQTLCGIVSNVLGETDFTDFFKQYDSTFKEWFETIKGQLSEDAAGNLQAQINAKADIVISEERIPVSQRSPKTIYFISTDEQEI